MTPTELIAHLRDTPICVQNERWLPEHVSRSNTYAQYKRRFPCGESQSLHYEVERRNDTVVNVVLHCERNTRNRDVVLQRLGWVRGETDSRLSVIDCSQYAQMEALVAEVERQMSRIAAIYEPRIREIN